MHKTMSTTAILLALALGTLASSHYPVEAGPEDARGPDQQPPGDATNSGDARSAGGVPVEAAAPSIHHRLLVRIDPATHELEVHDTVTLPGATPAAGEDRGYFVLHAGLSPSRRADGARIRAVRDAEKAPAGFEQVLAHSGKPGATPLALHSYRLTSSSRSFTMTYHGTIAHPVEQTGETYARDFRETAGTIGEEGVYLAGSSFWIPWFGDYLVTFDLEVALPPGWKAVSQGERTVAEDDGTAARSGWRCVHPQDQVYLVAGRWTEYVREGASVTAMAFLREPDEGLANRYLDATERYIDMYNGLLGPYPYGKFALVENFWETGYGMPSFTLLGPRVIRFPFILTSSYPHEILHNWWGNGVYVDYSSGNWCEGLTAYLADHLIQEQRGTAVTYRETTLQKYTDYAARGEDFPLTEFRERHSSSTEAVGYGKALMVFQMLRLELGDDTFIAGLRTFYERNRFREASWADIETAFEEVSGKSLETFFSQWVTRTGAPALALDDVTAAAFSDPSGQERYRLTLTLEQVASGPPYALKVPLAITIDGRKEAVMVTVEMAQQKHSCTLDVAGRPLRVDVDPARDLFRTLDRDETPPALSGVFGAERLTILLPSTAPTPLLEAYQALAATWKDANAGHVDVRLDTDLETFPREPGVWVFGWENRWLPDAMAGVARYDVAVGPARTRIGNADVPRAGHALVLAARSPGDPDQVVAFLGADLPESLPGLGRKLPHYHKYSFLGFEGTEPANMAKGRWPVLDSPLTRVIAWDGEATAREGGKPGRPESGEEGEAGERAADVPRARLPDRAPLVEPPPVFSVGRMMETVHTLASERYKGRGIGTPELDAVASYIARHFQDAGLQPAGDREGSFVQVVPWPEGGVEGLDVEQASPMKNIVGIIPGRNPALDGESVVVGAHYDHLGTGTIVGRAEDKGVIHPGADDNASGVAVLLEVARVLGQSMAPDRTVVFVAFSGEEEGLLGSRHFVEADSARPAGKMIAMINIDTVGRLEHRKFLVLGAGSAREWVHIFMGVGYTTGVQTECVARDLGSSDQKPFLDAGVPAIQLFSGPHLDYHRPTDTADKVDPDGLLQAATVVKEVLEYLAGREGPLTVTLPGSSPAPRETAGARHVSLGTVPDFAYQDSGVRLSGVVPGSPAQQAGLRAGDVIVRIGDTEIADLRVFSNLLKTLQPGDAITITFTRDGVERVVTARVVTR